MRLRRGRRSGGCPVGSGDDLQAVTGGIHEVDAAAAVIGIDLVRPGELRVGPVLDTAVEQSGVDGVEGHIVDEKGVVLHLDLGDVRLGELDEDPVGEGYDREWSPVCYLG